MIQNIDSVFKWLKASVNEHFRVACQPYAVYVQGNLPDENDDTTYIEIRLLDMEFTKTSSGSGYIDCNIAAILQIADNDDNIYNYDVIIGLVAAAFNTIAIYKYAGDDGSYYGCLELAGDGNDLRVSNFGRKNPNTKVQQAAVEGTFKLRIGET